MRRELACLALATLLAGCATFSRKDRTICPEYRGMRCLSSAECSMDAARGCFVCQCSPAAVDQNSNLPGGGAPDLR